MDELLQKVATGNAEHETAVKALNEGLENQKKAMIAAEAEHAQQIRDRSQEADGQIKQMQALQQETMTTQIAQMEQKIMEV